MKELEQLAHTAGETYEYLRLYLKNEVELVKLQTYERISRSLGKLLYRSSMAVIFLLGFLFFCITLAMFLGEYLGSHFKGFATVTGLYVFVILLFILFRKPLQRMMATEVLQAINEEENDEE